LRRSYRLCKYCGDLHQLGAWPHNCLPDKPARSDFPSPYVISDYLPGGINGLYHHAACEKIDSKSAYRRATREHGCIEVGNEKAALDRLDYESRNRELSSDVAEGAVNEALHRHGISSDSDMGKLDYGP
jgi:hypothetical protein